MVVPSVDNLAVHINDVFARDGNCIVGFVFFAHSFGEKPIQNREVNVNRGEAHTVVSERARMETM